jgi:metal-responsive CopG/Arc/MetJ family transcriptional regulator
MPVVSVELDDHLYEKISEAVQASGGSVEGFVRQAACWWLMSYLQESGWLEQRAARGSREAFERALAQVPHVPPDPGDEL